MANYIERAGVATASISLIREQSEAVRPPRALWVEFALGRPLGSAEDPEFQKDVLRACLGMLATATEPTIQNYAVAAPQEATPETWACPLNLPAAEDDSYHGRLMAEIDRLQPWAHETRSQRGRTLFGASGANPDQVDVVGAALASIAESGDVSTPPPGEVEWVHDMPLLVRHLADDLRTFYHEAIAGQPGSGAPNHDALNHWIFGGTAFGDTLQAIGRHLTAAEEPVMTLVRRLLIPEGHFVDEHISGGNWAHDAGLEPKD